MKALLPLLALAAPLGAAAAPRPVPGGEIRLLLPATPAQLDPARATSPSDLVAARALHATLVETAADGALGPVLLDTLPEAEPGGLAYRLRLAGGLRFQDGAAITAGEVAASLARLAGPGSAHAWLVAPVEGAAEVRAGRAERLRGVEVLSDRELRVALAHPFPAFPAALAALPAAVVRAGAAGAPVGAGPFRLAAREPAALRLAPFDGHARGRPFASGLALAGADARRAARDLASGAAQAVLRPEPANASAAVTAPLGLVLAVASPRLGERAPALLATVAAVDRGELARFLRAPSVPLGGLLPEALLPGARGGVRSGAGPLPARVRLLLPEGAEGPRPTAERLQIKLYDRGVRVTVETAPPAAFAARLAAGEHDLALVPVGLVSRHPALALAQVAFAVGGFARAAWALERAAGAQGLPGLAAALEEDLACVPLHASGLRLATAPEVQGLAPLADGTPDLADAWLLPGPARSAP